MSPAEMVAYVRAQPMPCPDCGAGDAWHQDEDGTWWVDCEACRWQWDPAPFRSHPTIGEYADHDGGAVRWVLELVAEVEP